jgi:hypothetical protein
MLVEDVEESTHWPSHSNTRMFNSVITKTYLI